MDLILSPLIKIAVEKAAGPLVKQFCQMRDMEENRKTLYRYLLAIQEQIADAEERGVNSPAMQAWMKELRAAAFKAVDVLDEFQYEALRRNAISQLPSSSTKVTKGFFSSENPILFRQKMSNKLTKVLGRINKIVTEMITFNLVSRGPVPTPITLNLVPRDPVPTPKPQTHSCVTDSEVIGRDGEKEEIVNTLLDPQRERDNISVLPIVGMGGLGKTTLAQLVYNDNRIKEKFHLLMWVCVSNEFNIMNIIKSIIEVARNECMPTASNMEVLQCRLREILDSKRYLLVLDDVWNHEEREKWDELKTLLTVGPSSGSVIMVTTRNTRVASIMGTLVSRDLASLNEEDAWKLFAKRAFGEVGEPEVLNKYGEIIVRKCGGVPLVVKAMGGLMRCKRDVREWRDVAESNIWEHAELENRILPILKLSFDELPSYSKQCFAFCAIYPQDFKIEREKLIRLWMANDFIPSDGTMDLEERGRCIFNDLYWRSFFQDMREDETKYGPEITCKMHDLMHDLATQIAGNKCSTMLGAQEEVEHVLMLGTESVKINSVLNPYQMIRTFLVDDFDYPQNIPSCSLRALRVGPHCQLPKNMRHMKNIRYLDLSGSSLDTLPEAICTLYHLQTLDLSDCYHIRELPENMRCMTNLWHLILDGCTHLERMPIGLGQLNCLRTLTEFIADYGNGRNIGELKNLNALSGHLNLSRLERVRDRDAKVANLAAKTILDSLELSWQRTDNDGTTENNQTVLEALTPHSELKYLTLRGYGGSSFPKWMMESLIIKNLKRLKLEECCDCAELPPVWQLPLLGSLHLRAMKSLVYVVGGALLHAEGSESLIIFHNLVDVSVKSLPNLESWHENDSNLVQFPKLKSLRIMMCGKLKTVPIHAPLLEHLVVRQSNEIKLHQISNLPMLSHLDISVDRSPTEPDAFRPPKTLVEMEIWGFENASPLEEEDNQNLQAASLRTLRIVESDCFFSCGPTKLALGFWKYFAALESLQIKCSNDLVFWPEEEFKGLNCLKYLQFAACQKLAGSLQAPRREDSLPRLEELWFLSCQELVEVPCCSKSLKKIWIQWCPKLSREGLGDFTNLTELKTLKLRSCDSLRALPDGMERLTSLERLSIEECPQIESFPEGLLQHLSALQNLYIRDCPALARRCRPGGDYWHLVSPIPRKYYYIPEEEEANRESFLRRLLPRCECLSARAFSDEESGSSDS